MWISTIEFRSFATDSDFIVSSVRIGMSAVYFGEDSPFAAQSRKWSRLLQRNEKRCIDGLLRFVNII